ncbi:hypothetical protein MKW98_029437, partial [Papaver atlanticum]
ITRGITTLPKVAIRDTDTDKLKVEVFEKSLDYYILVPNDENAEEAIRTQMRLAYVRYRSELAAHYRSFDSHEEALRHPSPRIRNVDDWAIMCDFFNTDLKFKVYKFTCLTLCNAF